MKLQDQQKASGNAQSLAVAAALAMLGVSVGVNITEILAASPPEQIKSKQNKLPSVQDKARGAIQQKLPSVQNKEMVMPGSKPVDPPR